MEKLRIYSCSILAIKSTVNEDDFIMDSVSMHLPALIPAETIQDAAEACRQAAYQNWPVADKWHSHQAAIAPVTSQFYEAAFNAYQSGAIGEDTEREQMFSFDPDSDAYEHQLR